MRLVAVVPVLLVLLLARLGVDLTRVDDYFLGSIQELLVALVAVCFLKKTDNLGLLRRRGSGFFNGILVGMFLSLIHISRRAGSGPAPPPGRKLSALWCRVYAAGPGCAAPCRT